MKTLAIFSNNYWFWVLPLLLALNPNLWRAEEEPSRLICPNCDLSGKDFSDQDLSNANLAYANLKGANFEGATLEGAMLANADLENANLENAILGSSEKGPTVFVGARLREANFDGADLGDSDFQYADISCANFSNTDIRQALFGPALQFDKSDCRPIFQNTVMNCEFPAYWDQLDLTGATMPDCSSSPTRSDLSAYASTIYVASNGADNSGCGTSGSPCQTIQYGINQCPGTNCAVIVAWGQYTPTAAIQLKDGVSVLGGYYNEALGTYQSNVTAPAGSAVFHRQRAR